VLYGDAHGHRVAEELVSHGVQVVADPDHHCRRHNAPEPDLVHTLSTKR